ncbi:MAG: DUF4373 domain-containing protein [Bacteroidales bacterium]|nr:DUF4373 domain-containing protein [Bacteroidales bacterium]
MKWFKHSTLASYADDLVIIREELGFAGLGVYWQIMEMLHLHDGRYPLQSIMALKCKAFSAKKIQRVIELASSIFIDKHFFVCIGECSDTETENPSDEELGNDVCSDFPPSEISEQTISTLACIEETREKTESEEDEMLVRYSSEPWYPYIRELLPRNNSWHEVTCMLSGYGRLLSKHWHEAILQFVQHIISFDTASTIHSVRDARYYFRTFIRLSHPPGRELKEHLESISNDNDTLRYDNQPVNQLIPDNAPPRPSSTAQWNFATDEWVEVH